MLIFIDESGRFTPGDRLSLVCSLTIPSKSAGPCRREIMRVSKDWPRRDGELKAAALEEMHVAALIDVLFRHDTLFHAVAIDVSMQEPGEVKRHQENQALGITKFLLPEHHASLKEEVWNLRQTLERMPPQLYIQCVAMNELIWHVAEETAIYFSQRRPKELNRFEWVIDAKDREVTPQEKWWRDVIGPLGESRSTRLPFATVCDKGFDYTHFDRAFAMEKEMWQPNEPRKLVNGINIKKTDK